MSNDLYLFRLLAKHGVPFVVIGGHAVYLHGHRRATEDTDAVWLRSPDSAGKLHAALTEINAQYIGNAIDPATGIERTYPVTAAYINANHLMMLWTDRGFFDLFDYVPAEPLTDVRELYDSAIEIDGLRVCSLQWLRRMKIAGGRRKDLDDLDELPTE